MTAIGVLALVAFVRRQIVLQRGTGALLDLRTLTFRPFAVSLAVMCLAFMAMMGAMILLPLYLQDVLHLSTLMTGLLLMPGGLVMGLLGPVVGRAYDRFGAPRLVVPGAIVMAATLALFTRVGTDTSPWLLLANYVALMASLGLVFTPVFTSGLSVLPPHLYAHGSAVLGSLQQVSAAAGTAIVVSVMAGRAASATVDGARSARRPEHRRALGLRGRRGARDRRRGRLVRGPHARSRGRSRPPLGRSGDHSLRSRRGRRLLGHLVAPRQLVLVHHRERHLLLRGQRTEQAAQVLDIGAAGRDVQAIGAPRVEPGDHLVGDHLVVEVGPVVVGGTARREQDQDEDDVDPGGQPHDRLPGRLLRHLVRLLDRLRHGLPLRTCRDGATAPSDAATGMLAP